MSRIRTFRDGITNIVNQLANRRSAVSSNIVTAQRLDDSEARAMFRSGLGAKIIGIKTGYALNETLQFANEKDEELYKRRLQRAVKKASKFMLGFGRGIILLNERGADLSKPFVGDLDMAKVKLDVFSGDMVSVVDVSIDLNDERYRLHVLHAGRAGSAYVSLWRYLRIRNDPHAVHQ
jgi:hypothetical protein